MSGNANNTAIWTGADVYVADVGTEAPTTPSAEWGVGWNAVGLLDGEEGFAESRENETSEHYAWGGILYRRTSGKHKRTVKFVALEDNDVTFQLINPGSVRSTSGGVRTGQIVVPQAGKRFAIGFETRDGGRIRRRIAALAEVQEVGEIKESETEPTVYEITVVIFPDADGVLFTTVETDPNHEGGSGAGA